MKVSNHGGDSWQSTVEVEYVEEKICESAFQSASAAGLTGPQCWDARRQLQTTIFREGKGGYAYWANHCHYKGLLPKYRLAGQTNVTLDAGETLQIDSESGNKLIIDAHDAHRLVVSNCSFSKLVVNGQINGVVINSSHINFVWIQASVLSKMYLGWSWFNTVQVEDIQAPFKVSGSFVNFLVCPPGMAIHSVRSAIVDQRDLRENSAEYECTLIPSIDPTNNIC